MKKYILNKYSKEYKKISSLGYKDIILKEIEPNSNTDFHAHEFGAYACVVKGQFIVNDTKINHILNPGDFLAVNANQKHSEKTSAEGATLLLGKKYN
jgi:quercetin dioxygenase-like cupin family protein